MQFSQTSSNNQNNFPEQVNIKAPAGTTVRVNKKADTFFPITTLSNYNRAITCLSLLRPAFIPSSFSALDMRPDP